MTVSFLDVGAAYRELKPAIDRAMARVVDGGQFVLGQEVHAFEQEFAAFCQAAQCCAVSNGLDALKLALLAHGVGPGHEVIVPAQTFIATWLAVSHVGATLVPVDVQRDGANLDPERVAAALSPRTRAIIAVHLYGRPAALAELATIADAAGVCLIEDAAQAHGAALCGRPIGSWGNTTCFSFYPAKNLGAFGDGGAVVMADTELRSKVALLANYGAPSKYSHQEIGYNCRLDELQAAILREKLRVLAAWNRRRATVARRYLEQIDNPQVILPEPDGLAQSAWHLFVVRSQRRDALQAHLARHDIDTMIHYPLPPYLQPAYRQLGLRPESFPIATRLSQQVLSLPIGPHLADDDVQCVTDAVNCWR